MYFILLLMRFFNWIFILVVLLLANSCVFVDVEKNKSKKLSNKNIESASSDQDKQIVEIQALNSSKQSIETSDIDQKNSQLQPTSKANRINQLQCGKKVIDFSFCAENYHDYYYNPKDWLDWEMINHRNSCSRLNFKIYSQFYRNDEVVDYCIRNIYDYFLYPKDWLDWEMKNYPNSCSRFSPDFTRNNFICAK